MNVSSSSGIKASGLGRDFGAVKAVEAATFTVAPGEIVGLLGPNGAGKTTTLRMLATLLRPTRGDATVAGFDIRSQQRELRAELGYLTGDTGLYGRLTPQEMLAYFGALYGLASKDITRRVDELMPVLGFEGYRHRRCDTLSTGQKQRVSIARAILHEPQVLILDEPTSGLDILSAQTTLEYFRGEADKGKAILLSTHILSEVELICDRVVIIHEGTLRFHGSLSGLVEETGCTSTTEAFIRLLSPHEETSSL
jgi:sodium transport system ATP-binding protein